MKSESKMFTACREIGKKKQSRNYYYSKWKGIFT